VAKSHTNATRVAHHIKKMAVPINDNSYAAGHLSHRVQRNSSFSKGRHRRFFRETRPAIAASLTLVVFSLAVR
jgi:hypothetical protein